MTKEEEFKNNMLKLAWKENYFDNRILDITHYTSTEGLAGILNSGVLWATRFDVLNDTTERKDAKYLYDKVVGELAQHDSFYNKFKDIEPCDNYGWLFDRHETIKFQSIKKPEVFVISFSKNPDCQSLWNCYVKNDKKQGYALNFQKKDFNYYDHEPGFDIKCFDLIYNDEEKINIIKKILQEIKDIYVDDEDCLKFAKACIGELLFVWQDLFKNHHFCDEREHRILIVQDQKNRKFPIKYRVNGGLIVPYIEFPFNDFIKLVAVTCGPLNNDDKSQDLTQEYLHSQGYGNVSVKKSTIPIRY